MAGTVHVYGVVGYDVATASYYTYTYNVLADETFDENKSLLLFDPVATWKKTMLAPGTYTMRELLVPVFKNGECVYESPSVMEIRAYCQQEKDSLWEETRRLRYPHEVHVDLSDALWNMKHQLLDSISTKIVSEQ